MCNLSFPMVRKNIWETSYFTFSMSVTFLQLAMNNQAISMSFNVVPTNHEGGFATFGTRAVDPRIGSDGFDIDEDQKLILRELLEKIIGAIDRCTAQMDRIFEDMKMPCVFHGESLEKEPELELKPEPMEVSEEEKKPVEVEADVVKEEKILEKEPESEEMSEEIEQSPNPQSYSFIYFLGEEKELLGLQVFNEVAYEVEEKWDYTDALLDSISMVATPGQVLKSVIGTIEVIVDTLPREFYFIEMINNYHVEHPITKMIVGQDLVEWFGGFDPGIKSCVEVEGFVIVGVYIIQRTNKYNCRQKNQIHRCSPGQNVDEGDLNEVIGRWNQEFVDVLSGKLEGSMQGENYAAASESEA